MKDYSDLGKSWALATWHREGLAWQGLDAHGKVCNPLHNPASALPTQPDSKSPETAARPRGLLAT